MLHPLVKENYRGVEVKNRIIKQINSDKGKFISQFSFENSKTDNIEYAQELIVNSKLTLIDFWASWCAPCREEFDELKKLYQEFHSMGLSIVSVSMDKDYNAYKEALQTENLPWFNCLTTKTIDDIFFIPAVPYKYLIDEKMKIVDTFRGGGSENMQKLKELIDKYLKAQ
jgi:thiol-disulfide isomerase/thioredoxin